MENNEKLKSENVLFSNLKTDENKKKVKTGEKKKNAFPTFTEEEGRSIWKQGICKRKFNSDW